VQVGDDLSGDDRIEAWETRQPAVKRIVCRGADDKFVARARERGAVPCDCAMMFDRERYVGSRRVARHRAREPLTDHDARPAMIAATRAQSAGPGMRPRRRSRTRRGSFTARRPNVVSATPVRRK
jgi:hypothetical protein